MSSIPTLLAREFSCSEHHVQQILQLIDSGATVPFIARYRKEQHGSMDDQQLRQLVDRLQYLRRLNQRCGEIQSTLESQGVWNSKLAELLSAVTTLTEAEELYRPYQSKRRTRASVAQSQGLEPLAQLLLEQKPTMPPPLQVAQSYVNPSVGISTPQQALQGGQAILAQIFSRDPELRRLLKAQYRRYGLLSSRGTDPSQDGGVYRLYLQFQAPLHRIQGHQILAINRGEREGFLRVSVDIAEDQVLIPLRRRILHPGSPAMALVRSALEDAYRRLIHPSLEREFRAQLTEQAQEGAIRTFALNLKPLLMQPPVSGHVTMGLDPGYRGGCKVAVVSPTGDVLDTAVVYPTHGAKQREEAVCTLHQLVLRHDVHHIALGNGTGSHEAEQMTAELLRRVEGPLRYMIVHEAGASVYSASALGAQELPGYDVTLRSAVSIARRLQDPLAELVKLDPKSIGVGQYQHDMPQGRLSSALDAVVEDCVNQVGVDVNTASPSLLQHVSGLTAAIAQNIVHYRQEHGPFTCRQQLLKVPRLGPRTFEQCAGFLRIPAGSVVLDQTGIHPESYAAAQTLLTLCHHTLEDVSRRNLSQLSAQAANYGMEQLAQRCGVGLFTLQDIIEELQKPGRDPREDLPPPLLHTHPLEWKDLTLGMRFQGTVRNVVDFGAFVDIGLHQDGLIHRSHLLRPVDHPSQLLSVGHVVTVWVLEVDQARGRIGLTMRPEDLSSEA